MNILSLIDAKTFGLITLLLSTILTEICNASSILEVMLGIQPEVCSTFINSTKQSISDPSIIHPLKPSEQLTYEYTITTPNFPSYYPFNVQCISLIKAPNFNYTIVMEVRQLFDVEPSRNCARDFLEITDGPYGFSRKIGRFCNSLKPPKEVKSSGPFLWLRFRSDDNLRHKGFTLVYRFLRNTKAEPKPNYCYNQVIIPPGNSFNVHTQFLKTELKNYAKLQNNSKIPMECVFDFHVNSGFYTFLYMEEFKTPKVPVPCTRHRLNIFYKGTFEDDLSSSFKKNYLQICEGSVFTDRLLTYSTLTTFRIIFQNPVEINTMRFIMTSVEFFKGNCSVGYHKCQKSNRICISNHLLCNNEVNCPKKSDENCIDGQLLPPGQELTTMTTADPVNIRRSSMKFEESIKNQETNRTHAIILGSIGSILMLSMVFCLLLTIHSKKKDRDSRNLNDTKPSMPYKEQLQTSQTSYEIMRSPSHNGTALTVEKVNKIIYFEDPILSKLPQHDTSDCSATRTIDCSSAVSSEITAVTLKPPRLRTSSDKIHSPTRIGKYLSVPNPIKNDLNNKTIIPNNNNNSSNAYTNSKQNSSHHIQRASSMGSGLRKLLQESVHTSDCSENVEWYCGPINKGNFNLNNSSETINVSSVKSSKHVPELGGFPNFVNPTRHTTFYNSKSIPRSKYNNETDMVIRISRLQC